MADESGGEWRVAREDAESESGNSALKGAAEKQTAKRGTPKACRRRDGIARETCHREQRLPGNPDAEPRPPRSAGRRTQ